jgi:hypothetical protein
MLERTKLQQNEWKRKVAVSFRGKHPAWIAPSKHREVLRQNNWQGFITTIHCNGVLLRRGYGFFNKETQEDKRLRARSYGVEGAFSDNFSLVRMPSKGVKGLTSRPQTRKCVVRRWRQRKTSRLRTVENARRLVCLCLYTCRHALLHESRVNFWTKI